MAAATDGGSTVLSDDAESDDCDGLPDDCVCFDCFRDGVEFDESD